MSRPTLVVQGKPTDAMKEAEKLEFGALNAKDYIAGAEVLKSNEEKEQEEHSNNHVIIDGDFRESCGVVVLQ